MVDQVEFVRSRDPLLRDVGAEYVVELPVLGLNTRFESNSSTVIERVDEAFGDWRLLDSHPELITSGGARVRIVVHDRPAPPAGVHEHYVLSDYRVLLSSGALALCDPVRRESIAFVRPPQLEDRQQFRYSVIEAITFAILTRLDRQPLHAAAVTRNGVALVLAGPSGIGKSTLVYALARAGFAIMTDDSVYLQSQGTLRVWGMPRFLHLSEEGRRFFPELEHTKAEVVANGKTKIAIDARAAGFHASLPVADDPILCLLDRNDAGSRLDRISASELQRALLENLESGFDLFAETVSPAVSRLSQRGGWKLTLGESPQDAVPLVERLLGDS